MKNEALQALSREQLEQLIQLYCKNWLAMDGVWFQSVEKKFGMDEAMEHDIRIWSQFTVIEAKRIKEFLGLPDRAGLDGLEQALKLRLYANINRDEILREGNRLIYRTALAKPELWRSEQRYNALFRDIFDPILARFHYPAGMRRQVMAFYIGGITAVIAAWLKEDCRQTPDEIIRIIETCIFPREQGFR